MNKMEQNALDRQLIAALVQKDTQQALELVRAGADPNTHVNALAASDDDSPTAFLLACDAEWEDAQQGIVIEGTAYVAGQPFDDTRLVLAMLERGADLHFQARHKQTSLSSAVKQNRAKTAELLLQHGANVNAQDARGMTPLMQAVMNEDEDVVRVLLAFGADINLQDNEGETAMHYGCVGGINDIVPLLLTQGANPDLPGTGGQTVRDYARKLKRPDILALMPSGG